MKPLIFLVASLCFVATRASSSPGLNFNYYEGNWDSLPNFKLLTPVKSGTTANINLSVTTSTQFFGIVWNGFINIAVAGDYTFEINSDDGSQLFLNNSSQPLINNNGVHSNTLISGMIHLEAGSYPVYASFFQKSGGQTMEIYWSSNTGIARQRIPDNVFTTSANTTAVNADGLTGVRNFYFSSTSGDDSRTSDQAQNASTPWKTLNKLNQVFSTLQPGDAVLFKRGETFDGSIVVANSGTAGHPIIFSAYGTGSRPVINGLTTLAKWSTVGTNLYEADLAATGRVNLVTVNGALKALGRYPNSTFQVVQTRSAITENPSYVYHGSFTDDKLASSSVNWTGAEVVIRKNAYVLDRCPITNHSGNTISFTSPSSIPPTEGYGYFIQNSPLTLDQQNEWFYNQATKKLRIFSTVDPSTMVVKASTVKTLVSIDSKSDLTFDNLDFEGADTSVFRLIGSANIVITNCDFNYSGIEVVRSMNSHHITFSNNSTNNTGSYGLIMYNAGNVTIKNNKIINTGMLAGMGLPNQQGYGAIYVQGPNTLIEENIIDSVGQSAVAFNGGNNCIVRNNYINYFCRTVGDGGGIYTNGNDGFTGKLIMGNIVSNGYGNSDGTTSPVPRAANGIYVDEGGTNVSIIGNTVFNCVSNGIYIHQSHEVTVKGNTIYNNGSNQISVVDDESYADRIRNVSIKNNILFSKQMSQGVMYASSTSNDLAQFGSIDSNYYSRPFDLGGIISTQYLVQNGEVIAHYDLVGWNNKYTAWDANSTVGKPIVSHAVKNLEANKISDGTFTNGVSAINADGNTTVTKDTKLDGTAAKFEAKKAGVSEVGALINLGSAISGKSYRIRFSLIGSTNTLNLISYVRRFADPDYSIVSEPKYFALHTTRTECEYIYTATANETDVRLTIVASGELVPFWIDNLEVTPLDATPINIEDSIRFEYNSSKIVKSIPLDGDYTDSKNNKYSNSIDIQPFTSILLFKVKAANNNQTPETRTGIATIPDSLTTTSELSIYPNPAVNVVKTRVTNGSKGKTSMTMYNLNGLVVKSAEYEKSDVLMEKTLDVSSLLPGVYYIEYNFDDRKSVAQPFIKK